MEAPSHNVGMFLLGSKSTVRRSLIVAGGHLDDLLGQRGLVVIAWRPDDPGLDVDADDRCQMQPAQPRRNAGDVADHFLPGCVNDEVPFYVAGNWRAPGRRPP